MIRSRKNSTHSKSESESDTILNVDYPEILAFQARFESPWPDSVSRRPLISWYQFFEEVYQRRAWTLQLVYQLCEIAAQVGVT